jgi:hypothetical protein
MENEMLIQKSKIQKNGLLSSSEQNTFDLFNGNDIIDSFYAVALTEKEYASKKIFKMDFSNYEIIGEEGKYFIFSEESYFDLKSKYGKEYKSFVTQQDKNNSAWSQVLLKYTNLDNLEK